MRRCTSTHNAYAFVPNEFAVADEVELDNRVRGPPPQVLSLVRIATSMRVPANVLICHVTADGLTRFADLHIVSGPVEFLQAKELKSCCELVHRQPNVSLGAFLRKPTLEQQVPGSFLRVLEELEIVAAAVL
jgi:hypothetical protein